MGVILPLNPLTEESPLIERDKKCRIILNKKTLKVSVRVNHKKKTTKTNKKLNKYNT